jgi:hypothetical protein
MGGGERETVTEDWAAPVFNASRIGRRDRMAVPGEVRSEDATTNYCLAALGGWK